MVADVPETLPDAQSTHDVSLSASEYLPEAHPTHVVAADASEYLPAAQSTHTEDEYVESAVCPAATPYLPAPQTVHDASTDSPVSNWYLPAPQTVHDASADPPVPTRYFPAPQTVQNASAVCPVTLPYLPRRSPSNYDCPLGFCTGLLRTLCNTLFRYHHRSLRCKCRRHEHCAEEASPSLLYMLCKMLQRFVL